MFRKKNLLAEIELLENQNGKLKERVAHYEERCRELEAIVEFALNYGKTDVKFWFDPYNLTLSLCYLSGGRLIKVETPFLWAERNNVSIVENDEKYATIKRKVPIIGVEYYTLDKENRLFVKTSEPATE